MKLKGKNIICVSLLGFYDIYIFKQVISKHLQFEYINLMTRFKIKIL